MRILGAHHECISVLQWRDEPRNPFCINGSSTVTVTTYIKHKITRQAAAVLALTKLQ